MHTSAADGGAGDRPIEGNPNTAPNSNRGDVDGEVQPPTTARLKYFPRLLLLVAATCTAPMSAFAAGTRYNPETQRISLDYAEEEAGVVLSDIAKACDVDLSVIKPVEGKIGILLEDVTLGTAMMHVTKHMHSALKLDGRILRIYPSDIFDTPDFDYDCVFPRPEAPEEKRMSISVINQPIRDVLRDTAERAGFEIAAPAQLQGLATLTLRNATWRNIFRELLNPLGFTFAESEGVVRVSPTPIPARALKPEGDLFSRFDWAILAPKALPFVAALVGLCVHLVFVVGMVRTPLPRPALFAPKWLWALLILVAGVIPLLAYWAFHYAPFSLPQIDPKNESAMQ